MNSHPSTTTPNFPTDEAGVVVPKTHTYQTLDAWRGIACLWVLWFHSTAPLMDRQHIKPGLLYFLPLHGGQGIWMFFVISGYCIAHAATKAIGRRNGLWSYTVARFRRIYPPCWFSLVFYVLASVLATALVAHGYVKSSDLAGRGILHHGIEFYLSNLSLTQVLFHQDYISLVCWTLCYEVAFYALVGLAAFLVKSQEERRLLTVLHGLTLACLIAFILFPHWMLFPFDFWPMFGLGVLVYDLVKHRRQSSQAIFLVAVALVGVLAWRSPVGVGYHGDGGGLPFLFGCAFAVLIFSLHRFDVQLNRLRFVRGLSWIGLFSYSLYLIHVLVIGLVIQVLGRLHLQSVWVCVPLCVLLSVAAAYAFYLIFERPFIRTSSQVLSSTK